jgi:hypothetical protein
MHLIKFNQDVVIFVIDLNQFGKVSIQYFFNWIFSTIQHIFSTQQDFSPLNRIFLQYQATTSSSALERFRLFCVTCVHLRSLKLNISFLRAEDMQNRVVHSRLSPAVPVPFSSSRMLWGKLRQIPFICTNSGPAHTRPAPASHACCCY